MARKTWEDLVDSLLAKKESSSEHVLAVRVWLKKLGETKAQEKGVLRSNLG